MKGSNMLKAMPSPAGTNLAGLYLAVRNDFGAAYDSAEGENRGAEGLSPDAIAKLLEFLKGKVLDEDLAEIGLLLDKNKDGSGSDLGVDEPTSEHRDLHHPKDRFGQDHLIRRRIAEARQRKIAADSSARADFEKQNGIASRRIRVLG
jgi:hypothetical protein